MKKLICLLSLLVSTHIYAQGPNGLGIVFGDPSGITYQRIIKDRQFADFYFAYSWHDEVTLMADYKFSLPGIFGETLPVTPYAGIGAYFKVEDHKKKDDVALGVRVPVGFDWQIPDVSAKLFLELVPALQIVDSTDGDFQAGLGGRYYF